MTGVVDMKIFNCDPFRHITGVAKIMLTGIRSIYQGGAGWPAACGHENAIADNEFSLPCTTIVGAQVDEAPKGTIVIKKILAVIGSHDSPVPSVIDIICLAAVHE